MPRPYVMGILNVTPDSFSDGGNTFEPEQAVARALAMVEEGADIIDIGGESSRPGAQPVPVTEELRRVLPVIEQIRRHSTIPLSLDTRKASVAQAGLEAGVNWINDISAGESDPELVDVVVAHRSPLVVMHMRGTPQTMQRQTQYDDVVNEVRTYLARRSAELLERGIEELILDPGLGFAKTLEQNLTLLQQLGTFKALGHPIMIGASRKSFIQRMLSSSSKDILEGNLAVAAHAIGCGCDILRVHDVAETARLCRIIDALQQSGPLSP